MPTTIDRFFGVVQLCQNLATMQNNMRRNVVIIQQAQHAGRITIAASQQAMHDLGNAFLQRLNMNADIVTQYQSEVVAGATAIGVSFTDMTNVYNNLRTWATNLQTATITNQTQLDNGVTALLANVPAAMLAF